MSAGTVRSLDRGLIVLRLVQARGKISLAELHERSGLAKATLLRILSTLAQHGYVHKGLSDGFYHFALGTTDAAEYGTHLASRAGTTMTQLLQEFGWPSDMSAFDGEGMKIIETTRTMSPYAVKSDVIGRRVSVILSAIGRAFLAACTYEKRMAILKQTMSISHQHYLNARNPEIIEKTLDEVREMGYAPREPFIAADGLMAIAVPVRSGDEPIGALNVVFVDSAMTHQEAAKRYLKRLTEAADEIGKGFTRPPV